MDEKKFVKIQLKTGYYVVLNVDDIGCVTREFGAGANAIRDTWVVHFAYMDQDGDWATIEYRISDAEFERFCVELGAA